MARSRNCYYQELYFGPGLPESSGLKRSGRRKEASGIERSISQKPIKKESGKGLMTVTKIDQLTIDNRMVRLSPEAFKS